LCLQCKMLWKLILCCAVPLQALMTYVQFASLLGLLDIQWPSVLGGLFKAASWIMQVSPQVWPKHHAMS